MTNAPFFLHKTLIQQVRGSNQQKQIEQAKEDIRCFREEIDNKIKKINNVLRLLGSNQQHYLALIKEYEKLPTKALKKQITSLKKVMTLLHEKLKEVKPEKHISQLNDKYQTLVTELARREGL